MRIDLFDADIIATKQMLKDMEKAQKAAEWFGIGKKGNKDE